MSNSSKHKGTAYETSVRKYLDSYGLSFSRQPMHGRNDEGDLISKTIGGLRVMIECKDHATVTKSLIDKWKQQTQVERGNADADVGLLVIHGAGNGEMRRGDDMVYLTLGDAGRLLGHPVPMTFEVPNPDDEWICLTLEQAATWMGGAELCTTE